MLLVFCILAYAAHRAANPAVTTPGVVTFDTSGSYNRRFAILCTSCLLDVYTVLF
jgi:hypothetical protein